jgi:hypothetical protein
MTLQIPSKVSTTTGPLVSINEVEQILGIKNIILIYF